MSWARSLTAVALLSLPLAAHALTQVSGPLQIEASRAEGRDADHSATLSTTITNQGALPDRLINVACPGIGTVALLNGQMRTIDHVQRNGLDLPGSIDGRTTPVAARFGLSQATQPMLAGALIPCALYFQHAGQRIVVFALGAHEPASDEP